MAGQVDVFMTVYGKGYVQLVEEGKLKAPVVLSAERQLYFKKSPPMQEAHGMKGFVFDTWAGFFVRKDTPESVVQALHKALSEVANDPAIRAGLEEQAMIVPRPEPLTAMAKIYADHTARYREIAKAMNLQPQ
jgi:tripartite-type tricarboxylate transporter receptor subunit TctC